MIYHSLIILVTLSVIPKAGEFDKAAFTKLDDFETILSENDIPF